MLTRAEILALDGPALNAHVHTHLFGRGVEWAVAPYWPAKLHEMQAWDAESTQYPEEWELVPDYAADGNAMLRVVEKMREMGWKVRMSSVLESAWEVAFTYHPTQVEVHFVEGLPTAVSRCALLAVLAGRGE